MITERRKNLYEFLIDKAHTNEFISKEEICRSLSELYPRHLENSNEHSSYAYAQIRNDVRELNRSDVEYIIVSNPKGYKIANKEEAIAFIKSRFKRDLSSLKIDWNLQRKVGMDGQMILGNELKEVQTFIRGGEDGGC